MSLIEIKFGLSTFILRIAGAGYAGDKFVKACFILTSHQVPEVLPQTVHRGVIQHLRPFLTEPLSLSLKVLILLLNPHLVTKWIYRRIVFRLQDSKQPPGCFSLRWTQVPCVSDNITERNRTHIII